MCCHIARPSYDTACEVALPNGVLPTCILERACVAVEPMRGHLNIGCVVVWNCVAFRRFATRVVC
jgi:hypothetical protein